MPRKIFIWTAHPKPGSLCHAIADAYEAGARMSGAEIRRLDLNRMQFADNFSGYGPDAPALEPDLLAWQAAVDWADHLFFVHPYWWGAMPMRAKTVLDRALTPGFAYKYHQRGVSWDKLLKGKTADAVITSDTPPLIDAVFYRKPGRRVLKNQVFGFCGVKTRKLIQFGPVKLATPEKIGRWLENARDLGSSAAA